MFLRRYLDDFYFDMVMNNYDISYLESIDEDNFEIIELRNKLGSNYVYIIGNDMRYLDCLLNN